MPSLVSALGRGLLLAALFLPFPLIAQPEVFFGIEVVDEETGRGVPLVELTTVHGIKYVTDSGGRIAFHEPGLMNKEVFFTVEAHGYEFPKDGFGYPSIVVKTTPGERHRVSIRRANLAERLYRLSGAGIYRDTVLLGLEAPMENPLLNADVVGQDSVLAAVYHKKIYWFWGDTSRVRHKLGNFNASGATSPLPGSGGINPEQAINYSYFVAENGFAKEMAPISGKGPTWLSSPTVLADGSGNERLLAGYAKVNTKMEAQERGLVLFDDEKEEFVPLAKYSADIPLFPTGHSLLGNEGDVEYVYFAAPLPLVRVEAELAKMQDFDRYETFTPLEEGSRWEERKVERAADGTVMYGWKKGTDAIGPSEQGKLIDEGLLATEEALFAPRDILSGEPVLLHAGAVEWNPYRGRWILIASQLFGSSVLGEVWFAEADSPLGPWVYARKIITHDDYSFYNPKHHRFLDQKNGRIIYLEGTYTKTFSGSQEATPRYDYNQILYRMDLARPELQLPIAIYRKDECDGRCYLSARAGALGGTRPAFWALENEREGTVPIACQPGPDGACRLKTVSENQGTTLFYGMAPSDAGPAMIPLKDETGSVLCYVWEHPMAQGPVLPIRLHDGT